jgi:hypothetical protein
MHTGGALRNEREELLLEKESRLVAAYYFSQFGENRNGICESDK